MNISSKLTLYDMLAIVIPGFLLLILFSECCDCRYAIFNNGINEGIIVFIASYVIGMIYHKTIECLFNKFEFRNNEKCIKNSAEQFYSDYEKNGGNKQNGNSKYNRNDYYIAYYALMKENMLNSIPILEAQVVFIRNMLPLTVMCIIAMCCCGNFSINPCFVAIILLIIGVILVVLLIEIQKKICYLVWEGFEYLKELKELKNEN